MDNNRPTSGWVLETGKIGHANQCAGVLERLGIEPEMKSLRPSLVNRLLAPHGYAHDPGRLAPPWPDIVLASGRRTVPFARALRREAGMSTIVGMIGKPGIKPVNFDFVWANDHDRIRGRNVLKTVTSPHRLTHEKMQAGAEALKSRLPELPQPYAGVFIGGPNKVFRFENHTVDALCAGLASLADTHGLLITLSRRTPKTFAEQLTRQLDNRPHWLWDGSGENPVFGIFGLADRFIVTADSVNMLSEASFTGKPVFAVRLPGRASKFDRFHDAMTKAGYMRWFDGTLPDRDYQPPDATQLIADHIMKLWQERSKPGPARNEPD